MSLRSRAQDVSVSNKEEPAVETRLFANMPIGAKGKFPKLLREPAKRRNDHNPSYSKWRPTPDGFDPDEEFDTEEARLQEERDMKRELKRRYRDRPELFYKAMGWAPGSPALQAVTGSQDLMMLVFKQLLDLVPKKIDLCDEVRKFCYATFKGCTEVHWKYACKALGLRFPAENMSDMTALPTDVDSSGNLFPSYEAWFRYWCNKIKAFPTGGAIAAFEEALYDLTRIPKIVKTQVAGGYGIGSVTASMQRQINSVHTNGGHIELAEWILTNYGNAGRPVVPFTDKEKLIHPGFRSRQELSYEIGHNADFWIKCVTRRIGNENFPLAHRRTAQILQFVHKSPLLGSEHKPGETAFGYLALNPNHPVNQNPLARTEMVVYERALHEGILMLPEIAQLEEGMAAVADMAQ